MWNIHSNDPKLVGLTSLQLHTSFINVWVLGCSLGEEGGLFWINTTTLLPQFSVSMPWGFVMFITLQGLCLPKFEKKLQTTSKVALSISRDGQSTTSLGNPFYNYIKWYTIILLYNIIINNNVDTGIWVWIGVYFTLNKILLWNSKFFITWQNQTCVWKVGWGLLRSWGKEPKFWSRTLWPLLGEYWHHYFCALLMSHQGEQELRFSLRSSSLR